MNTTINIGKYCFSRKPPRGQPARRRRRLTDSEVSDGQEQTENSLQQLDGDQSCVRGSETPSSDPPKACDWREADIEGGEGGDPLSGDIPKFPRWRNYEYLDHPADVRCRARGKSIEECLCGLATGICDYMTDLDRVEDRMFREVSINCCTKRQFIYGLLSEVLYLYGSEYFITRRLALIGFDPKPWIETPSLEETDERMYGARLVCVGDTFCREKHTQGTEVKAITMHEMSLQTSDDGYEIIVLFDI